jgi:hypothetical protein
MRAARPHRPAPHLLQPLGHLGIEVSYAHSYRSDVLTIVRSQFYSTDAE